MYRVASVLKQVTLTAMLTFGAVAAAAAGVGHGEHGALLKAYSEATKINHPGDDPANGDGAQYDYFGIDIAVDGDVALIGAPGDDTLAGSNAGSVHVFVRSAGVWSKQAKVVAPDASSGAAFGNSVALVGALAVVGAPYADNVDADNSGAVYVFQRDGNTWQFQDKLTALPPQSDSGFGKALDFDGNVLIVGAPYEDVPGKANIGAAYAFDRLGASWSAASRIDALGTGSVNDLFADSVAVDGDMVVIGAPYDDTGGGVDAGSVYCFVRNAGIWTWFGSVAANDGAAGDFFGTSVAVSPTTMVVGARWDDTAAGGNAGSVHVFLRGADTFTLQTKITAFDAAAGDYFGTDVALQGDTLLIGAPYDNDASNADIGSAYAYLRSAGVWTATHKFVASGGQASDQLGNAIAISNGTALVGAVFDDVAGIADVGSVVAFTTAGGGIWSQQARLSPGGGANGDLFGSAVAINGDLAAIGAPGEDTAAGISVGVVYLYQRIGGVWQLQTTLQPNDGFDYARFGTALAISGDSIIVGAPGASGAAYVYTGQGASWLLQGKLTRADSLSGENFAASVAIDGDYAAVAARYDDLPEGQDAGSVTVFVRVNGVWSQQALLTAPDADASDQFGAAIALSGTRAVVGTPADESAAGTFSGSAHVFVRTGATWSPQTKLTAADAAASDQFGNAVALAGDTVLIGAFGDDLFGNPNQGSVYVFANANGQWQQQTKLFASDGEADDYFGTTLAFDAEQAVIGAFGAEQSGLGNVGAAYAFARSNQQWSGGTRLLIPDPQAALGIGGAVARSGATIVLGAASDAGDQTGNPEVGSVYLYTATVMVNAVAGAHGTISPSGAQSVGYGSSMAFTLMPDPGYSIAAVSGCAGTLVGNLFTTSSLSTDCTVTASFVNTPPAIAAVGNQQIAEDAGTQMLVVSVSDAETASASLLLSAVSSAPGLIAPPVVSPGVQADERVLSFAPVANQHGGPVTITLTLDDGFGQGAQLAFMVNISARNDAPDLGFAALAAHVAGSNGPRSVPAFASFDAGPDDEDATQAVDDYLIDSLLDDGGVLVPASVEIANDGTLSYTLTGVGGTAYVNARVRDNGAVGSGHQNTSASKQFAIEVAPSADLQVALGNQRSGVQDGEAVLYTLVVANAGPNSIGGVRLGTTHNDSVVNLMWLCDQSASSAACPSEDSGNGDLVAEIELPANTFLQFTLMAEANGAEGGFIAVSASAEPPAAFAEIDSSNNAATDQDPIVGIGIFSNSFENSGAQVPTLPAAAAAMAW